MIDVGRTLGSVVLTLLLAGTARYARAQAEGPSLLLELAGQAPGGFDAGRLQQRVTVYLGDIVETAWADGDRGSLASPGTAQARFVARLQWTQGAMTPLQVLVLDRAASPVRRYALQVQDARNWDELERLLALKLGSTLRAALAHDVRYNTPEPGPAPVPALAAAPAANATTASARLVAELGAGVSGRDGFEAPRLGGLLRGAVQLRAWSFGVAASLTTRHTDGGAGSFSDAIESDAGASVRYNLRAARSPWLLQFGADLGLLVARVEATREGKARTSYAVSPVSSLSLLGGVLLSAGGSVALLLGPALDVLWNRSQIHAGGVQVYDTGRWRPRADLRLVLAL